MGKRGRICPRCDASDLEQVDLSESAYVRRCRGCWFVWSIEASPRRIVVSEFLLSLFEEPEEEAEETYEAFKAFEAKKRKPKKLRVCRMCDAEFDASTYPRGGGWYCSKACWSQAKKPARLRRIDAENKIRSRPFRITTNPPKTAEVTRLRSLPYPEYLRTEHWFRKRLEAYAFYGRVCICGSKQSLNVHHRTYERLGRELIQDLSVLCERCHQLTHNGHPPKVPKQITGRRNPRRRSSR